MSIDIEHQNQTKAHATSTTAESKGKGKEKEIDLPAHENASDAVEPGGDIWGNYPLERFPSPPSDESDATPTTTPHAATPNLNTLPLDPPLMTFAYPPPPPLCDDPTWYAQMAADVHRHRAHLITQLDLAKAEAAAALADVTLAQLEHKAEIDDMQKFLDNVASVAGKNFVRKLIRRVQWAMENGDEDSEPEDQRDADHENSNGDDDEHEADLHDPQDESLSAGEGEEDLQDAGGDRSDDDDFWVSGRPRANDNSPDCPRCFRHEDSVDGSDDHDAKSRGRSESPYANDSRELALEGVLYEPSSPDCTRFFRHKDSVYGSDTKSRGRSESSYANDSRGFALEGVLNEPSTPDFALGRVKAEYSGDDAQSLGWSESSPTNGRNKRHREDEEEEELSPLSYIRKKVKLTVGSIPGSPQRIEGEARETEGVISTSQSVSVAEDHEKTPSELDSDEEYEVENLTLEIEDIDIPSPSVRHLRDIGRDPFRLRQNSGGDPELYIPK